MTQVLVSQMRKLERLTTLPKAHSQYAVEPFLNTIILPKDLNYHTTWTYHSTVYTIQFPFYHLGSSFPTNLFVIFCFIVKYVIQTYLRMDSQSEWTLSTHCTQNPGNQSWYKQLLLQNGVFTRLSSFWTCCYYSLYYNNLKPLTIYKGNHSGKHVKSPTKASFLLKQQKCLLR